MYGTEMVDFNGMFKTEKDATVFIASQIITSIQENLKLNIINIYLERDFYFCESKKEKYEIMIFKKKK